MREVYERAISSIPPAEEKRLWRRYICLRINYAMFEELLAKIETRWDEECFHRLWFPLVDFNSRIIVTERDVVDQEATPG